MKKILLIIGFLVILFPNIVFAEKEIPEIIDIPLLPEPPQGKLITENGQSYVAFTMEEYSKIVDDYQKIYKLKFDLLNAEDTIDFLHNENYNLRLSLEDFRYNYFSLAATNERQRKRHIATTIIFTISTAIAGGFIGATIEKANGN